MCPCWTCRQAAAGEEARLVEGVLGELRAAHEVARLQAADLAIPVSVGDAEPLIEPATACLDVSTTLLVCTTRATVWRVHREAVLWLSLQEVLYAKMH